jgi:hypothetical protein
MVPTRSIGFRDTIDGAIHWEEPRIIIAAAAVVVVVVAVAVAEKVTIKIRMVWKFVIILPYR